MSLIGKIDISMSATISKLQVGLTKSRKELSSFGASAWSAGKQFTSFAGGIAKGDISHVGASLKTAARGFSQISSNVVTSIGSIGKLSSGIGKSASAIKMFRQGLTGDAIDTFRAGLGSIGAGFGGLRKSLAGSLQGLARFSGGVGFAGAGLTAFSARIGKLGIKRLSSGLRTLGGGFGRLTRGLAAVGASFGRFATSIASFSLKGLVAGFAAVGVAGVGMIKLASDAGEVENKFKAVFGNMAADAMDWSDSFAGAVNRSKFGVRSMMADMQDLLKPMGFDTEQAAAMSKQVTQLAVDLASFSNLDDAEALTKLRSGLSGESEPLKALGINANDTAVNLKLMEMGIKGGTAAANEQQKVLARLAIIQEGALAKGAIGDAAKTADSVANSWKGLKGAFVDVATEIGSSLLPVAAEAITTFRNWIPSADGIKSALSSIDFVGIFQSARDWTIEVAAGFELMAKRLFNAAGGTSGLSSGFNTVKEYATALLDVIANFDITWDMMKVSAVKAFKQINAPVWNLWGNLYKLLGWLTDAWSKSWFDVFEITLGIMENLGKNIQGLFSEVWKSIKSGFSEPIDTSKFTTSLVEGIRSTIEKPKFKALLEVDTSAEDQQMSRLADKYVERKQQQMELANRRKAALAQPITRTAPELVDATKTIDIKTVGGDAKLKQAADKIKEDLKLPVEKFNDELSKLKELKAKGLLTDKQFDLAQNKLKGKYKIGEYKLGANLEAGSAEARSVILRAKYGRDRGIDSVAANTKQMVKQQAESNRLQKEQLKKTDKVVSIPG